MSPKPTRKQAHAGKFHTCVRCEERKPAEEFVNDRTRNSGKFPWCKPCVTATRREKKRRDALRPILAPVDGSLTVRKCPGCLTSVDGLHANRVFCTDKCKDKVRRWRVFGLEPDEYRTLIAANEGKCPICRRNVRKWVLDHNHTTGETTGATCTSCNISLLAYSYHDAEIAERLRVYLDRPPVRALFGERRYVGPDSVSNIDRMWGWSQEQKRRAA